MTQEPETEARVKIDACTYTVKEAGIDRYAVSDEFGTSMGYFVVKGRKLEPDDFGTGAHSILEVAKCFRDRADQAPKKRKTSYQVCQIVSFDEVDESSLAAIDEYQTWLRSQPGLKTAFFVHDPVTRKAKSIRVWGSKERMETFALKQPPAGAAEPPVSGTEVTPMAQDLRVNEKLP